jgi:hypothetical protein
MCNRCIPPQAKRLVSYRRLLPSPGTKASTRGKSRAVLEQQLEKYRRELAEAQEHLAEALGRQAATSVERSYGSFSRTIPLPFDPDPAKVEAKFDNGVLRIHLPKPAEVAQKQQKIEIKKG